MKFKMKITSTAIGLYLSRVGLFTAALAGEVDKLDAVPEHQRAWYTAGADGKFKLDLSKVEIEDATALKNAAAAAREDARKAKQGADDRVKEALKQFEGIDPVKVREIMTKFNNEEEAALIAAGKIDEVVSRRVDKFKADIQKQVDTANAEAKKHSERASKYMERVLDNCIRSAVGDKVHPSALKNGDILRAAREIFVLNEEGAAVQLDKDGQVVLGKDAKTPFGPEEWIEGMREKAPHWFPAQGSGGGGPGSQKVPGGSNFEGLSATERMTKARETQTKK